MNEEKEWPEWTDVLGNTYYPGDIVAVAVINGKSPQMVVARVERINRINSSGKLITARKFIEHPEPIIREKECYRRQYDETHEHKDYCTQYVETGEYRQVQSCTVRATPLKDARNFRRYSDKDAEGHHRAVTYSIPANIILIERKQDIQ